MTWWRYCRASDLQFTGCGFESWLWAPPSSGLWQATYTCVSLSPSSIIWYRQMRGVISLVGKVTAGLAESNGSLSPGRLPRDRDQLRAQFPLVEYRTTLLTHSYTVSSDFLAVLALPLLSLLLALQPAPLWKSQIFIHLLNKLPLSLLQPCLNQSFSPSSPSPSPLLSSITTTSLFYFKLKHNFIFHKSFPP